MKMTINPTKVKGCMAPKLSVLAAALLMAGPTWAQEITLRVADSFAEHHYVSKELITPWMARVEELTDGKVEFKYFPGESLAKSKDLLDAAKNRVADITYVAPLYISDRLPLSSIVALPGVSGNAEQKSAAYQKLMDDHLAEVEFGREGVVPLLAVTVAGYEFNMDGPPVMTVEDLMGKKMRSSGGLQEQTVEALGGVAVQIPGPEVYTALQRGTVDGSITPLASVQPYGFDEVLKSISINADLGTFPITYAMNQSAWAEMPDDVKAAMKQASAEVNKSFGMYVDERTKTAETELRGKGLNMYEIPAEVLAEFRQKTAPIAKQWADRLETRGFPANEVLEAWSSSLN